MEHISRFDTKRNSYLTQLANSSLHHHAENSLFRDKIMIGKNTLDSYGIGKTHTRRYVDSRTNNYDGIHLLGPSGCEDLTRNMISILKDSLKESTTEPWSIQSTRRPATPILLNSSPEVSTVNRFDVFNQGN